MLYQVPRNVKNMKCYSCLKANDLSGHDVWMLEEDSGVRDKGTLAPLPSKQHELHLSTSNPPPPKCSRMTQWCLMNAPWCHWLISQLHSGTQCFWRSSTHCRKQQAAKRPGLWDVAVTQQVHCSHCDLLICLLTCYIQGFSGPCWGSVNFMWQNRP